jgi:hypothetical protein
MDQEELTYLNGLLVSGRGIRNRNFRVLFQAFIAKGYKEIGNWWEPKLL